MILGNFMARAIADDCIPPKFILSYKGNVCSEMAGKALCRADTLLNMKHGLVRLDNVWGVGGGLRPVKYLIKQIILLLKEYLCSGDVDEASRCLRELEVPHFHHELVYEVRNCKKKAKMAKENQKKKDFVKRCQKLSWSLLNRCPHFYHELVYEVR